MLKPDEIPNYTGDVILTTREEFPSKSDKIGNYIQKYSSEKSYNPTHLMKDNRPGRSMGTTQQNSQTNNTDCKKQAPSQEGVLRTHANQQTPNGNSQRYVQERDGKHTDSTFVCNSHKILLYDDEMKHGSTITLVLLLQRCGITGDDLIVGIDPGRRIGLSVFYGSVEIERQLFISIERMSSHIRHIFKYIKSTRHLIRIGDGDMTTAWRICRTLDVIDTPYSLEFVNESGTSPRTRHCNSRGKQDMLAARAIAQRDPWVMA